MLQLPDGVQRPQLVWLCAVSVLYYAAVTVADDVAQSIFISRLGVGALPNIFLIKAGIDVVSAFFYLPLTRHRCPQSVWRALLAGYAAMLALSFLVLSDGDWPTGGAYLLYVAHEAIWSLTVIHWGILLLALVSPSQSKALFPMLFALGRLGALLGGLLVGALAIALGATNLLLAAVALALLSALTSLMLHPQNEEASHRDAEFASTSSWAQAWGSPLVRLIALSTAMMVVLRYGLRIVSLAEIRWAFDNDKDQVAAFLGLFSVISNGLALLLGLWVIPRILARVGVGAANLAYAASNLLAFIATWLWPSLASASAARFVEIPLKHALKTPLSVMFYAAENRHMRLAARAFVFGAAIPLATAISGVGFRQLESELTMISMGGVGLSIAFFVVCVWQNRRYRERLLDTLEEMLGPDTDLRLAPICQEHLPRLPTRAREIVAAGLASNDRRAHSLVLLFIGETLSHARGEALTRAVRARAQTTQ